MQTLNQSLADLYLRKVITYEDALNKSQDPDELKRLVSAPGSGSAPRQKKESRVLGA